MNRNDLVDSLILAALVAIGTIAITAVLAGWWI